LSNRGSFSLTPLYDILSMQPYIDKKQISSNHKFSMAVGNSRHYDLDKIFPRHFNETASKVNFSREGYIIWEELKDTMQAAIEKVYQILPHTFPQYIVESITKGIKNRLFQEE
jgi:serine/threonine-protein kinase HipA